MDHPNKIEPKVGQPINDLAWSLNHYMALAEHLGVCFGRETPNDAITVWIMVNQEMDQDQENFRRLRARLDEIRDEGEWRFSLRKEERRGKFVIHSLIVPQEEVDDLINLLREKPGPEGWGSTRNVLLERGLLQEDGTINLPQR